MNSHKRFFPLAVLVVFVWGSVVCSCWAQGTSFSYEGRLSSEGLPANGFYDFTFGLFDGSNAVVGEEVGGLVTNLDVGVSNGLFGVVLDFGGVFTGSNYWLAIGVRSNGGAGFTGLSPWQELTPTPYSIYAANAGASASAGAVAATNIVGTVSGAELLTPGSVGTAQLAVGAMDAPESIAGSNLTAGANMSYVATSASLTSIYLPTNANVGDVVQITGEGAGGWAAHEYGWIQTGAPAAAWWSVASSSDGSHLVAVVNGGGIWTSTNFGTSWMKTSAPTEGWWSAASSSDGSELVAAVPYLGIWISTNAGTTWAQTSALAEEWQSVASSSDGSVLAAASEGPNGYIYISTNLGATWTRPAGLRGFFNSVALSSDGSHFVTTWNRGEGQSGIYDSTNSGENWTADVIPNYYWDFVASSSDGTRLVAVAGVDGFAFNFPGEIWLSTNSGMTWTQSTAPGGNWSCVASSSDGTHLVAGDGGVYISTNAGESWNATGAPGNSVACSSDGNHWVAMNASGIYVGGDVIVANGSEGSTVSLQYIGNGEWQTFTPAVLNGANLIAGSVGSTQLANGSVGTSQLAGGALSAPADVAGTNQTAMPNSSYVITNAGPTTISLPLNANIGDVVQITGEGSGTWTAVDNAWMQTGAPAGNWQSVASSSDGVHLVAAVENGGIYNSTNAGMTWALTTASNSSWWAVASSADGARLGALDSRNVYTSSNSGTSWTQVETSFFWKGIASSSDGSFLVAVGLAGIYTSADFGVTWTYIDAEPEIALFYLQGWSAIATSSDGSHLIAVANQTSGSDGTLVGNIFTSTNSGVNWTRPISPSAVWSSAASSADGSHLVAVANGGGIWNSSDSGVDWAQMAAPTGAWQSVASSADGTRLVAAVSGGGIYTYNGPTAVVSGGRGSSASLEYVGNGQWVAVSLPQSSSNLPNTSVTRDVNGNFSAGIITAAGFVGNGSGLSNLNGASIAGTLPLSALPSTVVTNNESGVTLGGAFSGSGAGLSNFNLGAVLLGASNVSSVTLGGSNVIALGVNGAVGVGISPSPNYMLLVNGSVAGVGAYNNLSDARYKTNITALTHALEKIMAMRGVEYEWRSNAFPQLNFDRGTQIGFVAQEVKDVLPEAVSRDAEGNYSIAYSKVIPVLVEAIKDQERELEESRRDAKTRGAEIEELRRSVEELQKGR